MTVVGYGAGTDSTAMLVGLWQRHIPVDLILFADPGGEQPHTYTYLETMGRWLAEHGMPPITRVWYTTRDGQRLTLEQECLRSGTLPSIAYGYQVTIFEAFHTAGGVLVYGIPEFRLPKAIVANEVGKLTAMGVDLETDMVVGKTYTIDEMFADGYEAVFVGSGAGLPMFMGIPGETLAGVYSANEYLTRINLMKAYLNSYDTPIKKIKRAAIVGGGNVAMDAARCAKRMGAEHVYVVYRRSEAEMPARREEIHHAKEEGIEFLFLNNPTKILGDEKGRVRGMECIKMELGEPDDSGRRRPIEVPGSEFELDVDAVIMSLGTSPNPLIRSTTPGLEANRKGCLVADEDTMVTTREGVYAGGDAVTGAATVILAMGAGKKAAEAMDKYLKEKHGKT